jgi:hypothetical protein
METKRRRWNDGRQHSWRTVPWSSHTELWLGDRGAMGDVGQIPGRQVGPELEGFVFRPVVGEDGSSARRGVGSASGRGR